ncbi:MAG: D-glycero-beta-D-manno-heptose 1-phosphate adenylyltransferase [Bacteroidetes bacterium]|nr:D-glycero-beta-D-manno-heptose 1-phosphate adenylyltransferase [Bacteroidota bacterium]
MPVRMYCPFRWSTCPQGCTCSMCRAAASRLHIGSSGNRFLFMDTSYKTADLAQAIRQVNTWRLKSDCVVFTNGCFDLLHAGHVTYLEAAAGYGQRLVVGINSDASVRRLKGPARPIQEAAHRARVLAALACVDAVVIFEEDTPLHLITTLRPDVLAKGADYTLEQIVGAQEVMAYGGRVERIPLVQGQSTTSIVSRMQS